MPILHLRAYRPHRVARILTADLSRPESLAALPIW